MTDRSDTSSPIILSHFQVTPLLQAWRGGRACTRTSTDLGLTAVEVRLCAEGAQFPGGEELTWEALEEIAASENACFHVQSGRARKIDTFSEFTGRYYSLMPTTAAPTLLVSGIAMHRIKDTDPYRDTLAKIRAIAPIAGRVLDTSTGLGYTAIEAAKTADEVITIELDSRVLEIARLNPWSQSLFDNPVIQQIIGDSFQEIVELETGSFSRIIHDPPTLSLAGELYSLAFYRQAYRVLQAGGRMFHYVGNPASKSGARVTSGVMRRLQESGFQRVYRRPKAFGLVAYK
jgi:predicted methyltransferase